ncbi:MAG: vitamin K epoxide reductase family protein [Candidatus Acidiferrales bacterium]
MRYVVAVLGIAGVAVSFLSLAAHFAAPAQQIDVLRSGSKWNSAYLNQSKYADIHGIPVAALGILGYTLLVVLALLRRKVLTVYTAGIGLAYAHYLTNIEAHTLHVWCVYCVSSLVLIVLLVCFAFGDLIFAPAPSMAASAISKQSTNVRRSGDGRTPEAFRSRRP